MSFPIDLGAFRHLPLDPQKPKLDADVREQLEKNIQLCRDAIIFFTALAGAKGLGGHTGGPYDIVPELLIAHGFMRGPAGVVPVYFDEAGHRVAIQYLMSVLNGHMTAERLLHYRAAGSKLPGHPERGLTPGVEFSSGRLGHLWPYVNGVAMAHPDQIAFLFGSDGSQMEGNNAEAARLAVANGLEVKLVVDDNDVTISGHPSAYLPRFDVAKTLAGHGVTVDVGDGEDLDSLYERMCRAATTQGPVALINRRKMAPGVVGLEGSNKGHDVVSTAIARDYLKARGLDAALDMLDAVQAAKRPSGYRGTSETWSKNREEFGKVIVEILSELDPAERARSVRVFDCDLEGSCGLTHVKKAHPDNYVQGGVMERGTYSAAAGFASEPGRQGIFATFSAFLEMVISEITMARLNDANVLAHFSHAGVDDMADNTCHFGVNNFFAAGGLGEHDRTRLYFPADRHQMHAVVRRVFHDRGLRFVFSTRSPVPEILDRGGNAMFADGYEFQPDRDEIIRQGSAGYVVSYGEMLFRCVHVVETLRAEGLDVGLMNKPTLNVPDDEGLAVTGKSPFVLVVESQNQNTGLGMRYGTWLLARGYAPRYENVGSTRIGEGGLWEHMAHQGLDPQSLMARLRQLAGSVR